MINIMKNKIFKNSTIAVVAILVVLLPVLLGGNPYWISVLALAAINILMVSSLRMISLFDQISIGHVGFSLIGAYGSAVLMMKVGLPFWLTLFIGGIMAAIVALLLGYPFLKVKGIYFSILTLMMAETFRLVAYYWRGMTGGTQGLVGIPSPPPITLPIIGKMSFNTPVTYYYIAAVVVLVSLLILYLIERSHINFKWRAITDADELANSVGINVIGYKILNFTIACFFAGIAGALFASYQHNLSADTTSRFAMTASIYLIVWMVVGGRKNFLGAIVGTLLFTFIGEWARPMGNYKDMLTGVIAILVMLFMPFGIMGLPSQIKEWLKARKESRILKEIKAENDTNKAVPPLARS
jgi:branched-chain amino acid transport system permease protein